MRLLMIRHAEAEDASTGKSDAERRLTPDGRKQMCKAAKGLRTIVSTIDVLATSPLLRAIETGEIVAHVLHLEDALELPALAPDGGRQSLIAWLQEQPAGATIAIVGHEPYLSTLASSLISGSTSALLTFKKGACCLIEFDRTAGIGGGRLLWMMQPGQLKKPKQ